VEKGLKALSQRPVEDRFFRLATTIEPFWLGLVQSTFEMDEKATSDPPYAGEIGSVAVKNFAVLLPDSRR